MNITFSTTGLKTEAVWCGDERVGSLIRTFGGSWAFSDRLDYLNINPRIASEIRAKAADRILILNITWRLTS
jgi:hypothetical protein